MNKKTYKYNIAIQSAERYRKATDDEYSAVAEKVCTDMTAALQAIAVEEEPNPAKIKWNC